MRLSIIRRRTESWKRAFRDDMRDFYQQYDTWQLDRLRQDLPGYVHYRNHVRGYRALDGKPAITRLNEYTHMALPAVLDRLESYACYEIGNKTIPVTGCIRLFNRDAHLAAMAGREVTLFESLEGLEARVNGECVVLKNFRMFQQMALRYRQSELPPAFTFEPYKPVLSANC